MTRGTDLATTVEIILFAFKDQVSTFYFVVELCSWMACIKHFSSKEERDKHLQELEEKHPSVVPQAMTFQKAFDVPLIQPFFLIRRITP